MSKRSLISAIGTGCCLSLFAGPAAAAPIGDLALTMEATPNPVQISGDLTYSLTVANIGKKAAQTIALTDQLPKTVKLKASSPDCRFPNATARKQNKLTCKAKSLRPGASVSWSIMVAPTVAGNLTNSASVKFAQRDPTPGNNSASVAVSVVDGQAGNHAPVAHALSQSADPAVPYLELQLIGTDPDNDSLAYELIAASQGPGYDLAFLDPRTGKLYLALAPAFQGGITLPFRVTDGKLFSAEAQVTIQVQPDTGDKGTGGQDIDPKKYAAFDRSRLSSDLFGSPGAPPAEPPSVDLSPNFPMPGDQGQQGSCVAWAVGYALKSYQEGAEMGWALNATSHLFSPAYIYNQVNGGQDNGSQIYDALDLVINKGAATLAAMPYTDQDFRTPPSDAAHTEAAKFKGLKRSTLDSLSDLKGALAQRRPVVLGIEVFDQFYQLRGADSVYNSTDGSNTGRHGKHAVTAVGYDNNRYGGAVKVINSWGTGWGDNGFFWMPYSFFPKVTFQMWVLEDAKNDNVPPTPDPVPPPPVGNLPDLQIKDWNANLDFSVGGSGELEWEVVNGGQATAPAGATVSLMLSKDKTINASDTYVVYEQIPFALETGKSAYRHFSENNGIPFEIPQTIEPGDYYLALLVDDLNDVQESDETNNASPSNGVVSLTNNRPDLSIDTWYADWDYSTGFGALTYQINNVGGQTAPAGWGISLVLSQSESLDDPSTQKWWLLREQVPFDLPVSQSVYRDDFSYATFNLYSDIQSQPIPAGVYYMALWIDDANQIQESDELNNSSFYWNYVYILGFGSQADPSAAALSAGAKANLGAAGSGGGKHVAAYNGKKLPGRDMKVRKVRISDTQAGRTLEFLGDSADGNGNASADPGPAVAPVKDRVFSKSVHAADVSIFPTTEATPMPGAAPTNP